MPVLPRLRMQSLLPTLYRDKVRHVGRRSAWMTAILAAAVCLGAGEGVAHATSYSVTNLNDSGAGTLRQAILSANVDGTTDTITFAVTGTLTVLSPLPNITRNLTILGPGASQLTISGNNTQQILTINSSGSVTIAGITFANGYWTSVGGAAVDIGQGAVTIESCLFTNNQSAQGGAVQIAGTGTLTLSNDTFAYNASTGVGGAVLSGSTSQLVVTGSTFIGNSTNSNGGAIWFTTGTILNSTFDGNFAFGFGGALLFNTGTIINNTFVFNQAQAAGGAFNIDGSATVTHNTFYANHADQTACSNCTGAAIRAGGSSGSTSTLNNNIFDNNNGGGVYRADGILNAAYNVYWQNPGDFGGEADCLGCSSNTNAVSASADPLMPLNFYGGPTKSMMLTATSDARCAGGASLAVDASSHPLTTDQRGFPFLYGYCTNGGVDAGSLQSNYQIVTTNADSNDGACTSTLCSLRDAVAAAESAGGGDVGFSPSLNNQTIALGSGLELSGAIGIVGPGANLLSVAGGGPATGYGVFTVDSGAQAVLSGLTITNGAAVNGGGINNAGTLLVNSALITGNQAGTYGGGIVNSGGLEVLGSTISNNLSGHYGGGIASYAGSVLIIESTLSGNNGVLYGGGALNNNGVLRLMNSTISGNFAGLQGAGLFNSVGAISAANSIITGNELGTPGSPGDYDDVDFTSGTNTFNGGNTIGYTNSSSSTPPSSAFTLGALGYNGSAALQTMLPLPGSPAICGGVQANLPLPVLTDERGFPNSNTTYAGFSSSSRCVDAGAVQTNYTAVKFVQQPATLEVNTLMSPGPSVELLEANPNTSPLTTDLPAIAAPITLAYSGGAGEINGTLTRTTSAGVATYDDLVPNTPASGVNFETSVLVTSAGSGTTLTATSDTFYVGGPFAGYAVSAPATALDGTAFNFTVTAVDAEGDKLLTPTSDPVTFSSSDGTAILPGPSSLSNNVGTFSATLHTSGGQTITATDANNSLITGTSNTIAASGPATQLVVTGYPTSVLQGASNTGTVTALDASGFTAIFFNGLATMTISDSRGFVSSPVTFVNGVGTFTATFLTAGSQSITASGPGMTSIPETGITVTALPGYVVNTTLDDSPAVSANCPIGGSVTACTLRDAVAAAAAAGSGEITFDSTVFLPGNPATGNTIYLNYGTIALPSNVFLNGLTSGDSNLVTIDGNGSVGIFSVAAGNTAETLANLNFAHGKSSSGSVVANGGVLTVSHCTFNENTAGPAIEGQNTSAILSVIGSTFTGNKSNTARLPGGAIWSTGSATIVNSSFLNNTANGGGGAVEARGGSLTVTGSTFSGNSAPLQGGALECSTSNPAIIVNSTFTGNGNGIGSGGAISTASLLKIYSSTIAGNSTTNQGGGIYVSGASAGLTLSGTIVAGNTAHLSADIFDSSPFTDLGGNLANTNSSGASTINPLLAPLGNYGGTTQTMVPLPGSPAICNSSAAALVSRLNTDQRGFPNTNATYPGYSAGTPCVDSGAVQTNYTIAFAQQPSTSGSEATVPVGLAISPSPAVLVSESGAPFSGATVSMADAASALSGTTSQSTAGGTATFGDLSIGAAETDDTLTATLPLNPNLSLSRAATSYPFNVVFAPPQLTSPAPSSGLTGSSATFTWSAGSATTFTFRIGTTLGGAQVYASGRITDTSEVVATLPTNGLPLYARLYYLSGSVWHWIDYTYTASGSLVAPALTSPAPGSTLSGSSQTFTWDPGNGATAFELNIGTKGAGSANIFKSGWTNKTSVNAPIIPLSGGTLYVRLLYKLNGVWSSIDYTYTEHVQLPSMTSPAPQGRLNGASQTFTWDPGSATAFELNVGTKGPGSGNVFKSGWTKSTTANAPTIPTTGGTLYVRLSYKLNGVWSHIDYTYTEF